MTAAVRPAIRPTSLIPRNVSVSQMSALDLAEDVTDVVEEAIKRYGNIMPGINAEINGKIDGKWKSIPFLGGDDRVPAPRRQAEGKGHRSRDADRPSRTAAGGSHDVGSGLLWLGPHAEPVG